MIKIDDWKTVVVDEEIFNISELNKNFSVGYSIEIHCVEKSTKIIFDNFKCEVQERKELNYIEKFKKIILEFLNISFDWPIEMKNVKNIYLKNGESNIELIYVGRNIFRVMSFIGYFAYD